MTEPDSSHPRIVEGMARVDGLTIRWRGWLGEAPPRAVFLIVHGLAEHGGRYGELVAYFNRIGIACYALDLRGHGHSEGRRVHVDTFDEYDRDVEAVLAQVAERHPGLPIFLVGHSMGGLIVLRHLLRHPGRVDGAIVSSPGLAAHPDTAPNLVVRLVAKILRVVAPALQVPTGLDAHLVSRDQDVVAAYKADPLVGSTASSGWYFAILAAQKETLERAGGLTTQILLMQSGDDRLVDPSATDRWVQAAPPAKVTYQRWTGLYHEMFHEPERDEVFDFTEEWLGRRLERLASDRRVIEDLTETTT